MDISFKSNENTEKSLNEILQKSICEICFKNKSQYNCPKCNISYCSLNCYRDQVKHLNCSESFYQDQVINELKTLQIGDVEEKNKLAEILRREKEAMEDDQLSQNNNFYLNEVNTENINKVDDQELLKVYKKEALQWEPWWLDENLKKVLIKEINKIDPNMTMKNFNTDLIKNAQVINVSNASNLIYNEMLKLSYLYFIVGYVYQLKEDSIADISLNDEISFSLIQMNKQLTSLKTDDLKQCFDLAIKTLSTCSEENFFLKNNINKVFLINLLNDLIVIIKSPNILLHLLSNLYNIFQASSSKKNHVLEKTKEIENECPINYFHFNKSLNDKKHSMSLKKSRVEIISKPSSKDRIDSNDAKVLNQLEIDTKTIIKDSRLFLKKLEYYFKWICLDENYFQCTSNSTIYIENISYLKESLIKEHKEVNEKIEFFDKNLKVFRKNQSNFSINEKLIKEI